MKDSKRVLIALVLALVLGAGIAASGNASLLHAADAIEPIGTLWVNAIRMTVIPLVVALLVTGVAATSGRAMGRLGGRTIAVFALQLVYFGLIVVPIVSTVFANLLYRLASKPPLPAGAAEAASQLTAAGGAQTFSGWLVSLIPVNPVAAAANGAMIPLIVFSVLFALALAHSPSPGRERLVGLFEGLRDVMLVLVGWIVATAPIGVFALML